MAVDSLDLPLDKSTLSAAAGRGRYQIDDLQADMSGGYRRTDDKRAGGQTKTPLQQYGPVALALDKGVFSIQKNNLQLQQKLSMSLQGKVRLADEKVDFVAGVPMSASFLRKFGASREVASMFEGQEVIVPLTGTIDNLHYDEKALAKHMADEFMKAAAKGVIDRLLPGGLPGLPKMP